MVEGQQYRQIVLLRYQKDAAQRNFRVFAFSELYHSRYEGNTPVCSVIDPGERLVDRDDNLASGQPDYSGFVE